MCGLTEESEILVNERKVEVCSPSDGKSAGSWQCRLRLHLQKPSWSVFFLATVRTVLRSVWCIVSCLGIFQNNCYCRHKNMSCDRGWFFCFLFWTLSIQTPSKMAAEAWGPCSTHCLLIQHKVQQLVSQYSTVTALVRRYSWSASSPKKQA